MYCSVNGFQVRAGDKRRLSLGNRGIEWVSGLSRHAISPELISRGMLLVIRRAVVRKLGAILHLDPRPRGREGNEKGNPNPFPPSAPLLKKDSDPVP